MAHIIGFRVWGFISVKVLTTALIRAPTSFLGPNYGPLMGFLIVMLGYPVHHTLGL